MIWFVHPGSRIQMLTFSHPGSRLPDPDPQHCLNLPEIVDIEPLALVGHSSQKKGREDKRF